MMICYLIRFCQFMQDGEDKKFWLLFIINDFIAGTITGFVGSALQKSDTPYAGLGLAVGIR